MEIDDYIYGIEKKLSEQYNQLLRDTLKTYGIAEENTSEYSDRVHVIRISARPFPPRIVEMVCIDGEYAFSIERVIDLDFENMRMNADVRIVREGTNV